jgi:enoyl-CoA hydratase
MGERGSRESNAQEHDMTFEHIAVAERGPLALITVRRPDKLNALNSQVLAELTRAVAELELSYDVRCVAITGEGDKAFIAGADIAEMRDMGPAQAQDMAELGGNLAMSIESSTKPYIAAVNGFALGGGCELALACDFIYAAVNARFGQPEVKLGVIPGFGGTQRLARRVGVAKAKELIFTGDMIDAVEALRIGLADKVVEPDALQETVAGVAGRIAACGPLAVAEAKKLIHAGQSMPLEAAILLEQRGFATLFDTEDRREGMAAFTDKRKPTFRGR